MMRLKSPLVFVDAFAGCGGLSLGLMQAGMKGLFAVERDPFAFASLETNLLADGKPHRFAWPTWLPREPLAIQDLISRHQAELLKLRGKIDVLAGGPPCQGFSTAGRRRPDDPRNQLFRSYLQLVETLEPKIVLMENVRGFTMSFGVDEGVDNYAHQLRGLLEARYSVHERLINVSAFGVPQNRTRYFLIALHDDFGPADPFQVAAAQLPSFLRRLSLQAPVSSWSAIGDLEAANGTRPSRDSKGFEEIVPGARKTSYQKLMGEGCVETTDLRMARHTPIVAQRFGEIIEACQASGRLNTTISQELRERYGLKKHALRVLDPDRPAPTITSMPDDLLHYSEARTLTVRENARIQSFPDWFEFRGKYTTGGERRRVEVPRFTQVANAVPPLAARAIGETLVALAAQATAKATASSATLMSGQQLGVKVPELLA
jgi:DNA (cytosine-5)-methyltransferase 1